MATRLELAGWLRRTVDSRLESGHEGVEFGVKHRQRPSAAYRDRSAFGEGDILSRGPLQGSGLTFGRIKEPCLLTVSTRPRRRRCRRRRRHCYTPHSLSNFTLVLRRYGSRS